MAERAIRTEPLACCCICRSLWQQSVALFIKLKAGGRHNMPPPRDLVSLTFWPWKWCPSHVWRGLPLCQFWSS